MVFNLKKCREPFLIIKTTLFFIISFFSSCSTEPEAIKFPQELTWTSDTLDYKESIQTRMTEIWASSSKDVWVCGHNAHSRGKIYHYDGKQWRDADYYKYLEGGIDVGGIYGFSAGNVWITGYHGNFNWKKSMVGHYDGTEWKITDLPTSETLWDIWGENQNDIWACGNNGIVYHYNGSSWVVDTVKIDTRGIHLFTLNSIIKYNGSIYAKGYKVIDQNYGGNVYYNFKKIDQSWVKIDSSIDIYPVNEKKFGSFKYYLSKGNRLFSCGVEGLFEFTDNSWHKVFETDMGIMSLCENKPGEFLAVGYYGKLYYSTGKNWELIKDLGYQGGYFTAVWTDGKEIFILSSDSAYPEKTIVFHGK